MITKEILSVNAVFYTFLKEIITSDILTDKVRKELFDTLKENKDSNDYEVTLHLLRDVIRTSKISQEKKKKAHLTLDLISTDIDFYIYRLAFLLVWMRSTLLDFDNSFSVSDFTSNLHLLSKRYDDIGRREIYYRRANMALICKVFFENIEEKIFLTSFEKNTIAIIHHDYKKALEHGVDPNQIFMIQLMESLSQKHKSESGNEYEQRIRKILIKQGLTGDEIFQGHDKKNNSLEYDLLFTYENRVYGIGAKRTLRERYKQFNDFKDAEADVFITITLGDDLNESKLDEITKNNMYVFVADEIYDSCSYMQNNNQTHRASKFNLETLKELD